MELAHFSQFSGIRENSIFRVGRPSGSTVLDELIDSEVGEGSEAEGEPSEAWLHDPGDGAADPLRRLRTLLADDYWVQFTTGVAFIRLLADLVAADGESRRMLEDFVQNTYDDGRFHPWPVSQYIKKNYNVQVSHKTIDRMLRLLESEARRQSSNPPRGRPDSGPSNPAQRRPSAGANRSQSAGASRGRGVDGPPGDHRQRRRDPLHRSYIGNADALHRSRFHRETATHHRSHLPGREPARHPAGRCTGSYPPTPFDRRTRRVHGPRRPGPLPGHQFQRPAR